MIGFRTTIESVFFSEYLERKKIYYVIMEMGSCDLSHIFKKEISVHQCVREPMRVFYWTKMLQAVKAIHELGGCNILYLNQGQNCHVVFLICRRRPLGFKASQFHSSEQ